MSDALPPRPLRDEASSPVGRLLKRLPAETTPGPNDEARAFKRLDEALMRPPPRSWRWVAAPVLTAVAVVLGLVLLRPSGPGPVTPEQPTLVLASRDTSAKVGAVLTAHQRVELARGSLVAVARGQARLVLEADEATGVTFDEHIAVSAPVLFAAEQIGSQPLLLDSGSWELRLEQGAATGEFGGPSPRVTVLRGHATLRRGDEVIELVGPATWPSETPAHALRVGHAWLLSLGKDHLAGLESRVFTATGTRLHVFIDGVDVGRAPLTALLPPGANVELRDVAPPALPSKALVDAGDREAGLGADTGATPAAPVQHEHATRGETTRAPRLEAPPVNAHAVRHTPDASAASEARLDQATRLSATGRPVEAARVLEALGSDGDANAAVALYELGTLRLRKLNDPRGAADAFRAHQRRFPSDDLVEDVEVSLIEALIASSAFTDAEHEATAFLTRFERSTQAPAIRLIRANIRREWGDCRAATADYTVLEEGTGLPASDALFFHALCARRDGNVSESTRLLERLRARFPKSPRLDDARRLEQR